MGGESATHAWRGVTAGVVLVTGGLWAWFIADLITPASVLVPLLVGLAGLLGAAALGGVAALVLRLLRVRIVPGHVVWAVVAALPLLNLMTRGGLSSAAHLLVVLVVVGASALAGGAIALVAAGGWRRRTPSARVAVGLALVAGAGTLLAGAALLAWSGPGADREPVAPERALAAGDPFAPGPYGVRRLTYGSGTDRHRPEFAEGAALRTRPVDGSGVVEGWSGVGGRMRTDFWGFGPSDLPLDGRVWYPAAKGRFPLVLVVHGDHLASDFSDGGYAYLGERLASRGFIVASVDENFLNSADGDLSAIGVSRFGLQDDMEARAWLLLQHLRAWRAWNDRPGNPFSGRVDLGRIALVGHSRGGEAVAAATVLNRRPGYGFAIRAVGAIAPTDDTFRPAGRPVALDGVDYLALAGSADGDVLSFGGADQYRRTTLRAGDFKAAVLVDRANHSQFNTTWGRYDSGYGAARRLLGTKALLAPADERRVAGVFVSAFLDASLRGRRGALRLLRDPGSGRRVAAGHGHPQALRRRRDPFADARRGHRDRVGRAQGVHRGARRTVALDRARRRARVLARRRRPGERPDRPDRRADRRRRHRRADAAERQRAARARADHAPPQDRRARGGTGGRARLPDLRPRARRLGPPRPEVRPGHAAARALRLRPHARRPDPARRRRRARSHAAGRGVAQPESSKVIVGGGSACLGFGVAFGLGFGAAFGVGAGAGAGARHGRSVVAVVVVVDSVVVVVATVGRAAARRRASARRRAADAARARTARRAVARRAARLARAAALRFETFAALRAVESWSCSGRGVSSISPAAGGADDAGGAVLPDEGEPVRIVPHTQPARTMPIA